MGVRARRARRGQAPGYPSPNGGITVISPDGRSIEHLSMPDDYTTNLCFDGRDLRTAYVTLSSSGQLVALEWPRPGLALNFRR